MNADVAVIGLGTIGSMTSWQLAKKGASVIGFEQYGIGHDRSAHGGGSRRFVVASQLTEQTPFMKASHYKYRELEEESGQQLLSRGGTLTIGDPESERMKKVVSTIREHDIPHKIYGEREAKERFPMHELLPGEIAVLDKLGGVLRPEQTIATAVHKAQALGAKVYPYTEVKEIQPDSSGVTIVTDDGTTYRVGKVIVTTGPWANKLVPQLDDHFFVERIIMTWFVAKNPNHFTEEKFPNFSRVSGKDHIVGTPTVDGRLVRVSGGKASAQIKDARAFDKNVSVEDILPVRNSIEKLMPSLYPDPVSVIPFMDGYSTDHLPFVGATSDNENVILACGLSGSGFSQAPAIGEVAAQLALDEKVFMDIDHLSPKRFNL